MLDIKEAEVVDNFSTDEIHLGLHLIKHHGNSQEGVTVAIENQQKRGHKARKKRLDDVEVDSLPEQLQLFVRFYGCEEIDDRWVDIGDRVKLQQEIPGRFSWSKQII